VDPNMFFATSAAIPTGWRFPTTASPYPSEQRILFKLGV
jgi:hypothetical protein